MRQALFPIVTSVLFSGSYVAGKYTTLDLDPLTTTLARYLVALAVLALLALAPSASLRLAPRDLLRVMLLGVFGIVGYHYFFFASLRHTEVANTGIINATSPLATALLAWLLLRERLPARAYAGVAIALAGVVVLVSRGDTGSLLSVGVRLGDGLMLLAVLSWAIYGVLVKGLSERYSGFTLTFHATLFGVGWLLLLAPFAGAPASLAKMSATSSWAVLYMGVCGSGLGYLTYNLSVRAIGPTRTASAVYSLVAILVAALALAFFGEPVTPVMAASALLVLLGLWLVMNSSG